MKSVSIYADYAPIYDAIGLSRFSVRMAGWVLAYLHEHGLPAGRVLDLACGTGDAALAFAAAGCQVVGVDAAPGMLAIAQAKVRDAHAAVQLLQADLQSLPSAQAGAPAGWPIALEAWAGAFDLVTCFADSLNYLTDADDLARFCAGVALALRPGGTLVFDLNTEAEYATWDERDVVVYDGPGCMVYNRLAYNQRSQLATGQIVWFVRDTDRWWRGSETHTERAWPEPELRAALEDAGLVPALIDTVEGASAGRRTVWLVHKRAHQAK